GIADNDRRMIAGDCDNARSAHAGGVAGRRSSKPSAVNGQVTDSESQFHGPRAINRKFALYGALFESATKGKS
ncbi:hypothetical protein, partial [Nocardia tenerifensis]|uniref:hypothetical protein n=1 Tax=Nocardia tenerifensis TaxID=228006 RepID=UPI001C3F29DA